MRSQHTQRSSEPLARLPARRAPAPRRARPAAAPAPIVKWAGGKTRLLDELLARRPKTIRRYFEPFLGGGALFFRLGPARATLTDSNRDLIHMYRCVARETDEVGAALLVHRRRHDEAYYYAMRDRWNQGDAWRSDAERAAAFIYLNKTCYNGLWRVNRRGLFNVPVGRYTAPQIFDPTALAAAAAVLARAELRAGDYREGVAEARAGDFVYFDPPYHPVTSTAKFTSYTSDDFGEDDQRRLAALVRELDARGCAVMVSNSDTPFIRKLYRGFTIARVEVARAINSRASARGAVGEVIVTNTSGVAGR